MAGLRFLLPMLHPGCHHPQRTVRGQSEWLVLLCRTLSFPIPNRFNPALSLTPFSPPSSAHAKLFVTREVNVGPVPTGQNVVSIPPSKAIGTGTTQLNENELFAASEKAKLHP